MTARIQGCALALYFALLPYVVVSKWRASSMGADGRLIRGLLVVLAVLWVGFLCQVVLYVGRLRRGRRVSSGGSAWLAGLVVAVLAMAVPASRAPLREPVAVVAARPTSPTHLASRHKQSPASPLAGVPLALMAKRRSDTLRQQEPGSDDLDVEESIALLRSRRPEVIAHLVEVAGEAIDGVVEVREDSPLRGAASPAAAMVACSLGPSAEGTLVGFAREGGRLPILPSWSGDDVTANVVALHDGKVSFARSERELLRALATRTLRPCVVVYLGAAADLDDELAACAIGLQPYVDREAPAHLARAAIPDASDRCDLVVELLRADPQVVGLAEPFTPALRRRCIELAAYLAIHRREPVTGERLRTRVLAHADVDASQRTLANTASALRRSLGLDQRGPRLHPVTSSGLYATHGLTSDVELFATLVARARELPVADGAPLAHQALLLVKGEPMASALRGFEWFLAEGHGARLARDGEWAALALHHASLARRNFELAFWAVQQGLLIDPYSDALAEALTRVPRLREFGGDGAGRAQNGAVSPRGAVAMSWSLAGLSQQVFQ